MSALGIRSLGIGRGWLGAGEGGSGLLARLFSLLTELLLVGESMELRAERREELDIDLQEWREDERDAQDDLDLLLDLVDAVDLQEAELLRLEPDLDLKDPDLSSLRDTELSSRDLTDTELSSRDLSDRKLSALDLFGDDML